MEASWLLWHLLRTPIGGALAVVFYCILRGGLVSKSSSADLNVFFLAGTAGLVGLFTTTAMQWLRDSFNNLPHPSKGQPVPAPVIDRLIPDTLSRAAPEPSIQVVGKGFAADSIVTIDGARQEAVASPPTMIKVKVNVADPKLATNGKKSVIVINPGPGDGVRSQSHDLTITD